MSILTTIFQILYTIFMIGFFDSGLGGLSIFREVVALMPQYSYVYLGDNARTPYGSHSHEVIYQFTRQGVARLLKEGARLVVLACNTASSSALRRIQQEFLPKYYPDRRVLGIIIPTAEEAILKTKTGEIGILATEATVHSFTYPKEITKLNKDIKVRQQACPLLVPIIEAGELYWEGLELAVRKYTQELFSQAHHIDTLVLGCTHYGLIEHTIRTYTPSDVRILSQGEIVAKKLVDYFERHLEISQQLDVSGKRLFYSTEDSWRVRELFKLFYGQKVDVQKIRLGA